MLKSIWRERTLRGQILLAIVFINLCALLIAGTVTVLNARKATQIEIDASLELAKRLVRTTIEALASADKTNALSERIEEVSNRLELADLRHVRILMAGAAGDLVQISPRGEKHGASNSPPPAPRWFAALVEPSVRPRELSIALADPTHRALLMVERPLSSFPKILDKGTIVILGEPTDEIAEVWEDVSSVAAVWLGLDAAILAVLYLVLGRMLTPLENLARGMQRLEGGQYATRIETPKVKELTVIGERFNQLAEALARSRAENARLYGQLITLQEEERREVASELHDEASPCLFGIMANTLSLQRLAGQRQDRRTKQMHTHVSAILEITDHLNLMNRALLKKLRPATLGRVALSGVLNDLMGEMQRRYPDVRLSHNIGALAESYGENVDLTLYRCIQEGVTNAIRHGKADSVSIELLEKKAGNGANGAGRHPLLQLRIEDDGRGLHPGAQMGFGTMVMRERVQALGGSCMLQNAAAQGTALRVSIPVESAKPKSTAELQMARAS